jgi:SRSO17 transposase
VSAGVDAQEPPEVDAAQGRPGGVDHRQLQQFVSSSPWSVEQVWQLLVDKAIKLTHPVAWVVDDTGFSKEGATSPDVAQQY